VADSIWRASVSTDAQGSGDWAAAIAAVAAAAVVDDVMAAVVLEGVVPSIEGQDSLKFSSFASQTKGGVRHDIAGEKRSRNEFDVINFHHRNRAVKPRDFDLPRTGDIDIIGVVVVIINLLDHPEFTILISHDIVVKKLHLNEIMLKT